MNNKYSVIYSPQARADIRAIYTYIRDELKEPKTARDQSVRIRETIKSLDSFPERHTLVDWEPWQSLGMRKMPIDNYIIFYLTDKENQIVRIIRILYAGRNIEKILK